MNANSKLTLQKWLKEATESLVAAGVSSPRLDAQLIAAHVLKVEKSWLLTHPEHIIDSGANKKLGSLLQKRETRQPMAYLLGHQEFYGRDFLVGPDVLIPRPETESIITLLKQLALAPSPRLLDVGTGSGALAITAALELPSLHADACDISGGALKIARKNAKKLHANVHFFESDLLGNVKSTYDVIAANLPYVDSIWQRSAETQHEPSLALFAGQNGLELITKLIDQTPHCLKPGGCLLLEADPRQHQSIIAHAAQNNLTLVQPDGFCLAFKA